MAPLKRARQPDEPRRKRQKLNTGRRAIQDTAEVFAYVLDDLNYHGKRLTGKLALELLHCILNSREQIRDEWGGFIRWNGIEQKFEYFDRRKTE